MNVKFILRAIKCQPGTHYRLHPVVSLLWISLFLLPFLAPAQPDSSRSKEEVKTMIAELNRKAEAMKKAIRKTPSNVTIRGTTYYVAAKGNDANDGLSIKKPLRSLDKVNALDLREGDAVLFRRGDLWRGSVKTKSGVAYSAYGKGAKPKLYGSPYDASKEGTWSETETPHVYVYDRELSADIGTLVFNNGESCAVKVMIQRKEDGTTLHLETLEPFRDYRDLKRDLEFYHDYKEAK